MAKCLAANPAAATVADHPTTSVATLRCVGTRGLEAGHGAVGAWAVDNFIVFQCLIVIKELGIEERNAGNMSSFY